MIETLETLMKRSLNLKTTSVGNPMDVIPIKNVKNAKNTVEIHLAKRGLDEIVDFEKFPNLECLWMNENKFESIHGLDTNFRLRELYFQDNKIKTLEGSISSLTNLRVLSLYNNEIRGLDKSLQILAKLRQLEKLDLFGNPIAEEPYYRLKVIFYIPSLKVFDRHVITFEEREKAKEWYENDTKNLAIPKKKIVRESSWKPSQSEKELFHEARTIRKRYEDEKKAEEDREKNILKERFQKWYKEEPPVPKFLIESHLKLLTLSLREWDKIYLLPIFASYGGINIEKADQNAMEKSQVPFKNMEALYNDVINDKGFIGMVPIITYEEFLAVTENNGKDKQQIKWPEFRRSLDKMKWTIQDKEKLKTRIDDLYKQANRALNMGQPGSADLLQKANRLEKLYHGKL